MGFLSDYCKGPCFADDHRACVLCREFFSGPVFAEDRGAPELFAHEAFSPSQNGHAVRSRRPQYRTGGGQGFFHALRNKKRGTRLQFFLTGLAKPRSRMTLAALSQKAGSAAAASGVRSRFILE